MTEKATETKKTETTSDSSSSSDTSSSSGSSSSSDTSSSSGSSSKKYVRGENQKPVTDAYRDNWNDIFKRKKSRKR